jgi:siroheme synthase
MSAAPLDEMVERLLQHGIGRDKWLAVIEQATTPLQRVSSCPIHEYLSPEAVAARARTGKGAEYVSPTLIIIGKVAALHEQFKWLPDSDSGELYFKPVSENQTIKAEERA